MKEQVPFYKLLFFLNILNQLELSSDYLLLNADGFAMEMQLQNNDKINVV